MDEKPGGAPQDTPKPNSIGSIIDFAFSELTFMNVEKEENQKYLVFLVREDYMITMLEWEYFAYLSYVHDCILNDKTLLFDNIITLPEHEVLKDDIDFNSLYIENEEIKTSKNKKITMYYIWDLVPNTNTIETDNKINLN